MELVPLRDVLRCVVEESGAQSVMTCGTLMMLLLYANN